MKTQESQFSNEIFIIGFGVIAKALAVALAASGRSVTILRGSVDGQEIRMERLEAELGNRTVAANVTISSLSHHDQLDGIIVLTNKTFGNPGLANKLRLKTKQSPIVFLQNGLQIEDSFINEGFNGLYRCVVLAASQAVTDHNVRFRPVAPSPIGIIKGATAVLGRIIAQLNTAIFPFRTEDDIQPLIWKKVISNCVFNSICPLLETDNGIFHRSENALSIAKTVIAECIEVARENHVILTSEEMLEQVLMLSKMSDGQKISTYQDILNKRETEIRTMNLAISGLAGQSQIQATRLLGELIRVKSGY